MPDLTRYQPKCYYLTPDYSQSFWGRHIWIYQGHGSLSLDAGRLAFRSRSREFDIPLEAISGIGMGSFAETSKPFGLVYLSIRFEEGGKESTIYLVPAVSALAPTWRTSRLVESWFETLRETEVLADRVDLPLPSGPRHPTMFRFGVVFGSIFFGSMIVFFGVKALLSRMILGQLLP